jgi:uncharacterized phage-associated protein
MGHPITNLKLQKLLYYAQAWHLAFYGRPLFGERIEAWVHGPVVPPVFGDFKHYGWSPIEPVAIPPSPSAPVRVHVDCVYQTYGGFSANDLERMTHQEDPWKNARNGLPLGAPSKAVISHESMKRYYRSVLNGQKR